MATSKKNRLIDINGTGIVQGKNRYSRPMPEQPTDNDKSYLYTFGGEYTTIRGDEWIGEYHIRKGGLVYTGAVQSKEERDDALMLLPYYESNNNFTYDRLLNFRTPLKDHNQPVPWEFVIREEEGQYEQGFTVRYFVQKIGPGNYAIEIDQAQRDEYSSPEGIDNRLYKLVDLPWRLTGTFDAVEKANKEAVTKASLIIPDLPFVIRNYTQYARATKQTEFGMMDAHMIPRKTNLGQESIAPGQTTPTTKLINPKIKTPLKQTYDPETGLLTTPTKPKPAKPNQNPRGGTYIASTRS